jgi:hypothetical protein
VTEFSSTKKPIYKGHSLKEYAPEYCDFPMMSGSGMIIVLDSVCFTSLAYPIIDTDKY